MVACIGCAFALASCGGSGRDDDGLFGSGQTASADGTAGDDGISGPADGTGNASTAADDSADAPGDTDEFKFDTPSSLDEGPVDTSSDGCNKVDFLFVIDNSISMGDEQQNLAVSFPQFIDTIQSEVVDDWRVMVIDTDPQDKWDEDLAECHEGKCDGEDPTENCGVITPQDLWTCGALPDIDECDAVLGSGVDHDRSEQRNACGLDQGRWFDDAQPDADAAFACASSLYDGNSPELGMEGMLAAVSPELVGPGGCNEGFLRDDAVLVVTVITDEEDDGDSLGDPMSWHDDLLARKNGNATAIVVLGLVGDTSLPGAVCPPDSVPGSTGGEYSPRLISFVESFGDRGLWGSVCAPDYSDFFAQAVALIDTACDEFEPEG
ncbi:MAG TPA: hypothetical protein VFG69_05460 [Nannocystaceae bacterium]|nr:hypothetical protein [Nannocystaceae bacterium]